MKKNMLTEKTIYTFVILITTAVLVLLVLVGGITYQTFTDTTTRVTAFDSDYGPLIPLPDNSVDSFLKVKIIDSGVTSTNKATGGEGSYSIYSLETDPTCELTHIATSSYSIKCLRP